MIGRSLEHDTVASWGVCRKEWNALDRPSTTMKLFFKVFYNPWHVLRLWMYTSTVFVANKITQKQTIRRRNEQIPSSTLRNTDQRYWSSHRKLKAFHRFHIANHLYFLSPKKPGSFYRWGQKEKKKKQICVIFFLLFRYVHMFPSSSRRSNKVKKNNKWTCKQLSRFEAEFNRTKTKS